MRNTICKSVGAIIKNKEGEYLVLYRLNEPKGLAMPAGHLEEIEGPGEAIRREVLEETGARIINIARRYETLVNIAPYRCGRGADLHWWCVYEVLSWEGEPRLCEPDKHRFVKFMPAAEIAAIAKCEKTDPSWSQYIWKDMGIL